MTLSGYPRPDGNVGFRNYLLVLPSVFCANQVAEKIAHSFAVDDVLAMTHGVGCSQVGADLEQTARVLSNIGLHPNVGAVLIVGLGCERLTVQELYENIGASGKPVEKILIQEEGGSANTIAKGIKICDQLFQRISALKRKEVGPECITLGLECGGTDATSGIAANPVLGHASHLLIKKKGTSIFNEVTELLGAEEILARRAINSKVGQEIRDIIFRTEERLKKETAFASPRNRRALISTGNFEGGVTTVVEKALGNIYKTGSSKIAGTLAYGEVPKHKGLFLMDSPGHDGESVTGLAAGGAQVIIFTTGRGTPTGFPIVPVIKVTGNRNTYEQMKGDLDFDASPVILWRKSIEEVGAILYEKMIQVLSGELTRAEIQKNRELFVVSRI